MKSKTAIEAAEWRMLRAQLHYAHKVTPTGYIDMLRAQVAYWQLLAEERGQTLGCVEPTH